MSSFTCITCRVAFMDSSVQRAHYKTDWHRYNLKRKVAELPPVTAQNFQERVLAQRANVAEESKSTATKCRLCSKNFNTENAYQNHLQSKKHREGESKERQRIEKEVQKRNEKNEVKGIEENEKTLQKDRANYELKRSLPATENNMAAASSATSASVTAEDEDMDSEDAESVESWEGDALGVEECLFCSHVSKSLERNVDHMVRHHSFFIPDVEYLTDLEGLIVYLGAKVGEGHLCLWCNERGKTFYSTEAVQKHMLDKGHCKMLHEGEVLVEYADFYDYRSSYPDYGASGGDDVEMTDDDLDSTANILTSSGYELVLPSGSVVGHRSLHRYFKQNLPPKRQSAPAIMQKTMAQYKAIGWVGVQGAAAQRRAKDMMHIQRLKTRQNLKYAMKANKFQPHYRDDNFGIRN